MSEACSVVELLGFVQNYAWGKYGLDSSVAQLVADHHQVDPTKPYSELWMGDHPSGPAMILHPNGEKERLDVFLSKQPLIDVFGKDVLAKFKSLPFLFKVLSINKALSVQAHPDEGLARKLHSTSPSLYPDPNHKPELALAVTPMQTLCGFRKEEEIANHLETVPQLQNVIGKAVVENFLSSCKSTEEEKKKMLKSLFAALMTADESSVKAQLESLLTEIKAKKELSFLETVVLRVSSEFPGDVGIFSLYLLNIVNLQAGSAIFLGPNEPHAYLQGDCIECMATSDNVVRAGLTPKFKDVETLVNMLTYKTGYPQVLAGTETLHKDDGSCVVEKRYVPPVDEFKVISYEIPSGKKFKVHSVSGPSIFIVYEGQGKACSAEQHSQIHLKKGSVLFCFYNVVVELESHSEKLVVYQATPNINASSL